MTKDAKKLPARTETLLRAITLRSLKGQEKVYRSDDHPKTVLPEKSQDTLHLSTKDAEGLRKRKLIETEGSGSRWNAVFKLTNLGFALGYELVGAPKFPLREFLDDSLELQIFHPLDDGEFEGQTPIPFIFTPGDQDAKVVLVLGPNAGGKSFFRRVVSIRTNEGSKRHRDEAGPFPVGELIGLSMEKRVGGGGMGMMRSMIYGTEDWSSTGENSAHTVITSLKTLAGRRHQVIIYWDEPDIGMSPGAAAGAGIAIREFADSAPAHVGGLFLTSHSPALVAQVAKVGPTPHYLYLGDDKGPQTIEEWVKQVSDPFPTPVSPEQLKKAARLRFKKIQYILDGKGK